MELTIERFDLSEELRVRNTARRTASGAVLPVDFPFLVDEETGELVEPVLLHLAKKFWGPGTDAIRHGRWRLRNSADAAASDLKDWWGYLAERELEWDRVADRDLGLYLKGLRDTTSEQTGDFLADATYSRRCASIEAFHNFAAVEWPDARFPSLVRAALGAGVGRRGPRSHRTNRTPRPIQPSDVNRIAEHLGPLPSVREADESSRSRLAFELGLNVGLRVDEVCSLRADTFERMSAAGVEEDAIELEVTETKGGVPRIVFVPIWLVRELKRYIEGERTEAVGAARKIWLGEGKQPPYLFLNRPDAPLDAGKRTDSDTIDKAFNRACMELPGLSKPRTIAEGTDDEGEVLGPIHTFHDTRHTYAYWTYLGLTEQDDDPRLAREPWLFIQKRLGHADVATTIGTYMNVFDGLGTKTLAALGRYFLNARKVAALAPEYER